MKKYVFRSVLILHFTFYIFNCLYSATISSQRIGCVDINRIIKEYPEAEKIKEELSANLKTRKDYIKTLQSQIQTDEVKIKNMQEELDKYNELMQEKKENAIQQMALAETESSTDTVSIPIETETVEISSPAFTQDNIESEKKVLEKQKEDLEKYIKETKEAEKDINIKTKRNIFSKIYDVIKEVSDREGLTVVVDSYSIIYGEDAEDITEQVLKKLK
ncbi:MAG: OmpH family outer membrane protein [Elusimicrobia bacterium]|nr:OmpH family outer membrane protein [Elusimicrobiota bacterium]